MLGPRHRADRDIELQQCRECRKSGRGAHGGMTHRCLAKAGGPTFNWNRAPVCIINPRREPLGKTRWVDDKGIKGGLPWRLQLVTTNAPEAQECYWSSGI